MNEPTRVWVVLDASISDSFGGIPHVKVVGTYSNLELAKHAQQQASRAALEWPGKSHYITVHPQQVDNVRSLSAHIHNEGLRYKSEHGDRSGVRRD